MKKKHTNPNQGDLFEAQPGAVSQALEAVAAPRREITDPRLAAALAKLEEKIKRGERVRFPFPSHRKLMD